MATPQTSLPHNPQPPVIPFTWRDLLLPCGLLALTLLPLLIGLAPILWDAGNRPPPYPPPPIYLAAKVLQTPAAPAAGSPVLPGEVPGSKGVLEAAGAETPPLLDGVGGEGRVRELFEDASGFSERKGGLGEGELGEGGPEGDVGGGLGGRMAEDWAEDGDVEDSAFDESVMDDEDDDVADPSGANPSSAPTPGPSGPPPPPPRNRPNRRPMVGILTHPYMFKAESTAPANGEAADRQAGVQAGSQAGYQACPGEGSANGSYVAAAYVRILQAGGVMVTPIFYDWPKEKLEEAFKKINMLIIPGGNACRRPNTPYYEAAHTLFKLAMEANDRGDYFPIHGTCLGFELMAIFASGSHKLLHRVYSRSHPAPLHFASANARDRAMFDLMDRSVIEAVERKNLAMHNHKFAILLHTFRRHHALSRFFEVLTTTHDKRGKEYVSTIRAHKYPFTATQWHPEKNGLVWFGEAGVPRGPTAMKVMQACANFFAREARQSKHARDSLEEEKEMIISLFPASFYGRPYDEIYRFPSASEVDKELKVDVVEPALSYTG